MKRNRKWVSARPDDTVRRIARRALAMRLERMWHFLELAVWQPQRETENVHQLRVFSRRAAAVLEIFAEWLPQRRGRWMQKHVKRLRQAAAEARDLDVLWMRWMERVEQVPSGQAALLLDEVKHRRREAQRPMEELHAKLARRGFEKRRKRFLRKIRFRGAPGSCGERFECMARESLSRLAAPYLEAAEGPLSDPEAIHAFRIQSKQMRYAMEIFAGAFDPAFRDTLYAAVAALQERLGTINDFVTARTHLAAWRDQADSCMLRQALEMGVEQEQLALDKALCEFLAWWTPRRRTELRQGFARYVVLPSAAAVEQSAAAPPPSDMAPQ